jgi:hypothetical protein
MAFFWPFARLRPEFGLDHARLRRVIDKLRGIAPYKGLKPVWNMLLFIGALSGWLSAWRF